MSVPVLMVVVFAVVRETVSFESLQVAVDVLPDVESLLSIVIAKRFSSSETCFEAASF